MQDRNRDTDMENGHVDMGGRGWWDGLGELDWNIYTPMCKLDSWWEPAAQQRELSPCCVMTRRGEVGEG